MTLHIRAARPGEAALVLSFVKELAEFESLSAEVDATEEMIAAALFGPSPAAFCLIAEWAGEPAGFAIYFNSFSSFRGRRGVYLEDIFVRPSHRGRGIGKAFLEHIARLCVANGWARFEWAVLDWNEHAIEFYRSCGATLLDEWKICRVTGDALLGLAGRSGQSED
ncbi:GNAT family N-acetyltransferase [Methylocystis heyeri]|uniref:GNAT family N-acetyltransferase n=1 Tax=Methylocystis heyeri TaxID=391905 RepID=A0A6B8KBX1_9HYPH|nr:GNAT family N-acetyltransferase [Methylocystis heyeri]QGM45686.1 GNAT family N-acetyltransferase [Methylocystis heyeri]